MFENFTPEAWVEARQSTVTVRREDLEWILDLVAASDTGVGPHDVTAWRQWLENEWTRYQRLKAALGD